MSGSSPRVRGSPCASRKRRRRLGIIPAGAGLTSSLRAGACQSGDHPRGCGAHLELLSFFDVLMGSSPRVRGSPLHIEVVAVISGIIPAGAGLTRHQLHDVLSDRDHPRGCGAHGLYTVSPSSRPGSSPRVRGSLFLELFPLFLEWIIPAGAGLTNFRQLQPSHDRDHPRGCGAHLYTGQLRQLLRGSSPRVRGSPFRPVVLTSCCGIIPAGAGLTRGLKALASFIWDHPRGCGAHFCDGARLYTKQGSSPRVRGSRIS